MSRNPNSPLVELLDRWLAGEFEILYSEDILAEYIEKILARGIALEKGQEFIANVRARGVEVKVSGDDVVPVISADPDDDIVLACAKVGGATHLVTYDPHFEVLGGEVEGIQILDGLHFLYVVRGDIKSH